MVYVLSTTSVGGVKKFNNIGASFIKRVITDLKNKFFRFEPFGI